MKQRVPENITMEIYLKIIIVCIAAIIGSGLSPDKKNPQDVPVVDNIVCMAATIQLVQQYDGIYGVTKQKVWYLDW